MTHTPKRKWAAWLLTATALTMAIAGCGQSLEEFEDAALKGLPASMELLDCKSIDGYCELVHKDASGALFSYRMKPSAALAQLVIERGQDGLVILNLPSNVSTPAELAQAIEATLVAFGKTFGAVMREQDITP